MIRIVTKSELSAFQENMLRVLAVLASLAAAALVILCMGYNPAEVFAKIAAGSLGSPQRSWRTPPPPGPPPPGRPAPPGHGACFPGKSTVHSW